MSMLERIMGASGSGLATLREVLARLGESEGAGFAVPGAADGDGAA